jgi:hypothetical protein
MKLEDETKTSVYGVQSATDNPPEIMVDRPMPKSLRYFTLGLLVISVFGVVTFGVISQTSVKPTTTAATGTCKDLVTENRLRETLKQSPNDFATLMDWGSYNLSCEKNYPIAVAAYQQATRLADDQATSTVQAADRVEAHFRLGLAYLYNQNFKEAQDNFELLVKEDPQNTSAMLALSVTLSKNDPAKAQTYLEQIIKIVPANSDMAAQAKTLLDEIKKGSGNK